jgi:hypothetical protein
MLAPIALCLLGHLDPSHFAGALTDEGPSGAPLEHMNRLQLQTEFERLAPYRTEFIGPTVMAGSGLVVAAVGAVVGMLGIFFAVVPHATTGMTAAEMTAFAATGYAMLGVGAVLFVVGAVFLVVGLVRLFPALARRREAVERRDEIQKLLDRAGPTDAPPLVPVPPPGAARAGPQPAAVLATF